MPAGKGGKALGKGKTSAANAVHRPKQSSFPCKCLGIELDRSQRLTPQVLWQRKGLQQQLLQLQPR